MIFLVVKAIHVCLKDLGGGFGVIGGGAATSNSRLAKARNQKIKIERHSVLTAREFEFVKPCPGVGQRPKKSPVGGCPGAIFSSYSRERGGDSL